MNLKLLSLALSFAITTPTLATDWEIKSDLKYTDGAPSDITSYEDNGDFDKRKVKKKRKTKLDTLITYSRESAWPELEYQLRLGHIFERVKERNLQLKEDGSRKKNKGLTELERITYAGVGITYKHAHFLGADRWVFDTYFDRLLHISYGATDLQEDAKDRDGSSQNGYKGSVRANGEYSTPWLSLYALPFLRFKEEYKGAWHNDAEDEREDEEREKKYEAGLYFNWITPAPGLEVIAGPYWQKETDYKREAGSDWESDDEERWIARLKLEYEAAPLGLEMEFFFEQDLNGEDQGETVYNFEISYEY